MILHVAQIIKAAEWDQRSERIMETMRDNLALTALGKGTSLGDVEIVEIVHIRHSELDEWAWVATQPESATHVKVTIERDLL